MNFEFSGAPEIDPLLQRFFRKSPICQFGGQKSKSSRGNFWGEFPPPSSVRYVLNPPILVSEKRLSGQFRRSGFTHESCALRIARKFRAILRITERGVGFKGGSLHDGLAVLTVLAVLESTLPSFNACPTKYSAKRRP